VGAVRALRLPIKLAGFYYPPVLRPPLLGEHPDCVLAGRLGLSPERIAQLREAKAI
jgi:crotonobetainyl-CoA:carnitine CoA-transferase CaiB-like acyl-CoA transferase